MRPRLLLGVVLLLSACGAPDRPLDLGFKEVPSDVILGDQSTPTPSAQPSAAPVSVVPLPLPPSIVTLPPPPFEVPPSGGPPPSPPPPLPTPPACPSEDLLAAPKLEAPTTVSKPPVQAAYLFDNVGTFSVSGADARKGSFPARTLRIINNIRSTQGSFLYDVAERIGDTTTTTTFGVVSEPALPTQEAGLFLQKMTYERTDGSTASFTPSPQLKLAGFPLVRGAVTEQRAVDPQTQTAMSYTSTVEGKARVTACGEPLDSWTVHLTEGTLLSPTQELEFDSTYQIATQYGGIVVQDAIAFTGTDGDAGVQRSNRATIAMVPRAP